MSNLDKLNDDEINTMLDRIAELEAALKPFADYARDRTISLSDADLRRAREVLPDRTGLDLGKTLSSLK
jgi:hypothetical protein